MPPNVINIFSIVEGDGDADAVPTLLKRMAEKNSILVNPIRTIIVPASKLTQRIGTGFGIGKWIECGLRRSIKCDAIFIFIDADSIDPICLFYPEFSKFCNSAVPSEIPVCIVFPNSEFETWFLAGVRQFNEVPNPEMVRDAKGKITEITGKKYYSVTDQKEFTKKIDFDLVKQKSRSFKKFEKEFSKIVELYHKKFG